MYLFAFFFLSVCLPCLVILFVPGPLFHPSFLIIHLAKQYVFLLVGMMELRICFNAIPTSENVDKNMFLNVLDFFRRLNCCCS